jgi:glutamate racemase
MKRPVGMLDSGLGGFSVYYGLKKAYPNAPLIILADQKNSPYGPKSVEELQAITTHNIELLESCGCQEILFACNTTSALLLDTMQQQYPNLSLKGVIDATIAQVQPVKKVAILATEANINSHVYKNKLVALHPTMEVVEIIPHHLVDYIEGLASEEVLEAYLENVLAPAIGVDALILGCTHYPLVRHIIEKILNVPLYDSIDAMVKDTKPWLENNVGEGKILTSLDADKLHHQLDVLFGVDEVVLKVGE